MKKFLAVLGILFLAFCGFIVYDTYFKDKIPVLTMEEELVNVDNLYIYGTHLNIEGSYSFTDTPELVLYNGEFISYKLNNLEGKFNVSELVNDGIYLDEIPTGDYYLFLRTTYTKDEEEKYKYYSLKNNSEYQTTTYYTMSSYDKKIVIDNEESYPTMMMHVSDNNDDNVYDIVIDPGHGGMDGGASKNGYKETDFTLDIANKLKAKLTDYGFTVKLTHEEGQLSSNDRLEEYGVHGRAVIPREVNAKYMFSIHLNSNNSAYVSGLEVYTAKNINYDFAKLLVNNITTKSGLGYSNNKVNKVFNSIYTRNFTENDIKSSLEGYEKNNLEAYDITTNSNYYYIIRETGGIVTGAYVDDRNASIIANPYVNSNVGTETYLLELGYLSNQSNLNNMINNMNKYVDGIADSIKTLYKTSK
ncbi:MAG: N-acetylmuramoyl-L-alanine amidase [Bacilli bacterium]|nr:N-acetylmuramoyl-L-alanine amidase [Bacilli bacterium]